MSTPNVPTAEELESILARLSPDRLEHLQKAAKPMLDRLWRPQDGPQSDAYYSEADELLYGGAAGGGKTDLICGLALTKHQRTVIFRRQSTDLDGLWERLDELTEGARTTFNSMKKTVRLKDGRVIECGHLEKPQSEKGWQGRPHDLLAIDEATQIAEFKVVFLSQWLRTTVEGQRTRLLLGTNPPIPEYKDGQLVDNPASEWIKRWFAPWLDDGYPNPAEPGELRWCFMRSEGDRFITVWVEGPGCYEIETGKRVPSSRQGDAGVAVAKSRTFIRARVSDNIYLRGTDYEARLSAAPEPLRSLLRDGSFVVKTEDHPLQVIPTAWVIEAQQRWHERKHEAESLHQLVLAADIAQGGADTTVIASLLDTSFFEELHTSPGRDTPTGVEVVQRLLMHRRNGSLIVLDGGGGWGGSTRDLLATKQRIKAAMFIPSEKSGATTSDLQYQYLNERAAMWWGFREALAPNSGFKIALPPSDRLLTQLTTPLVDFRGRELKVESKEEIRKRLQGASTDDADAVLMAWHFRKTALALRLRQGQDEPARSSSVRDLDDYPGAQRDTGHRHTPMDDPLGDM